MRKPMVAGNWKMNGSLALVAQVGEALSDLDAPDVDVIVCPPFPYVGPLRRTLPDTSPVGVGGQDVSAQDSGAFTGEVAGSMLAEMGCSHVVVGHSERRALHGETDALIAEKVQAALRAGLTPIVCVGETLEERDADRTEAVLGAQVDAILALGAFVVEKLVIAYEPVWAIGTGRTAAPEQAQAVHQFIRARVAAALGDDVAQNLVLLYGGSVKPANAAELFACEDVDGGLIGGAALDPAAFLDIVAAART
ncbi:triosephosphate isomerase [Alkalispirillum mobile]|uniref:Triosephosphate isomerase n=1 Tax=Alkalispirillum mobile TaxID=85925 RepID=A0A498CEU5_9GAMM|nr:triose-phosphate isomerase [Alkalispirillum mobile]RLK50831.1 triosephosphate isomerase [Alkalispirillum mobile]